MHKQYKHKKLGWIASYCTVSDRPEGECYILAEDGYIQNLSVKLIEDSNDWELVEEKDWIDKIYDKDLIKISEDLFRKSIEKHMPKITEEELEKTTESGDEDMVLFYVKELLKEKGLYKE